ncbi:MAG: CDP-alcohol phosphatidyltransferase family protein [Nitrospiraceae bacterium]
MDRVIQPVVEAQGRATAELDGFVDRHFNRKISGPLTRLFLRLGLSPNTITILSLLIGLAAAGSFALGTYVAGIVGGLLFQLSAIVDCCDGELARLTNRQSPLGAQLDLAADNVVHMAIFAGIAWGLFLHPASGIRSWLPLVLGTAAVLGNAFSFWMVNRAKALRDRQVWADPIQAARTEFILKNVASRDFSVAVLLFALLDLLPWFLWLVAIGINVFWIITAWVSRPATTARA